MECIEKIHPKQIQIPMNPNIAILTCTTENRQDIYRCTNKTKEQYIKFHPHIEYVFSTSFKDNIDWGLYWLKPQFILKYITNYDFILWMDDDAGIVNHDFDLIQFVESLDKSKSIFATEDENGINAGVILLKNSNDSKNMLNYMIDKDVAYKHSHWDQHAMCEYIEQHQNTTQLLSGTIFNAHSKIYTNNDKNMQNENTFIVHIGGGDFRKELLKHTNCLEKVFEKIP